MGPREDPGRRPRENSKREVTLKESPTQKPKRAEGIKMYTHLVKENEKVIGSEEP